MGPSKYGHKRRSIRCYVLIRRRHIKDGKLIAPMDFAEYLRNSDGKPNSEVCKPLFIGREMKVELDD